MQPAPDDPYVDPDSGCLCNRLGLTDHAELQAAERSAALLREQSIRMFGCVGNYDFKHLRAIHRAIFQDIYDWAGDPRTINTERTHRFCDVRFLEDQAARIFAELADAQYLRGLDREEFVERLTYFMSEVNALHPFREGNGRAQRLFFELLARDAGYGLDWSQTDERENVEACVAAMVGKLDLLRELVDAVTRRGPAAG